MKKALIIPHQAFSHIISSLTLSHYLKSIGFEVYYISDVKFKEIITANGFILLDKNFSLVKANTVHYSLKRTWKNFLNGKFFNRGFWRIFKTNHNLEQVMIELMPSNVFLDTSLASFEIFFRQKTCKLIYFNTYLCQERQLGYPPLNCYYIPCNNFSDYIAASYFWGIVKVREVVQNLMIDLLLRPISSNYIVKYYCTNFGMSRKLSFPQRTPLNTPIIELQPDALNYLTSSNVSLMPLKIMNRKFVDIDFKFVLISRILSKLKKAQPTIKIIVCSFGSLSAHFEKKKWFIERLVKIFNGHNNIHLIITTGSDGDQISISSKNVHLFQNINLVQALKFSDLYIGHGGINSIVEAIYCETPIVIYPTSSVDQKGNMARVKSLGIGNHLKSLSGDRGIDLIFEVLYNDVYLKKIKTLKQKIFNQNNYKHSQIELSILLENLAR